MFCTKCGKKLYDGDSFCAYCGAKVREELMFKTETKPKTRTTGLDEFVLTRRSKLKQSVEHRVLKNRQTFTAQNLREKELLLIGT